MKTKLNTWHLGVLAVGLFCSPLHAQTFSIDWYKVAGGGGTSTGGVYSVTGTIGQPAAGGAMTGGPMIGTNYSLTGGFWSLFSVVQTPGAPTLTITRAGGSVIVSWPSPSTGWTLQQNANLALANGWSASSGIADDGTTKSLTLTASTGNLFFRLYKP